MKQFIEVVFITVAVFLFVLVVGIMGAIIARADTAAMPVYCGMTADFEADLANNYRENVTGTGVTPKGNLVRLFQSEHTWTIVFTRPDGTSCTIAAGDDWQTEKEGNPT